MTQPVERRVVLPVVADDDQSKAAAQAANGMATIGRLADDLLPTLIARIGESALGELEVRQNGWRVRLRRGAAGVDEASRPAQRGRSAERRHERHERQERHDSGRADGAGATAADAPAVHADADRGIVTAPAVGYYLPLEDLAAGSSVRGGDLLGHVDVLGVRVDVVVPADGRLARLLAEPGEAVEYGQPLARLETESRD